MSHAKKSLFIIFLAAMIMRLLAIYFFAGEKSLLHVSDSLTYLQVAKNIINHGAYSMEVSSTPHPDNFRTPLYPLFLLPFVFLKTSLYYPVIFQNIIFSLAIALFYLLTRRLVSPAIALVSSLLYALEPFTALISGQIMTEPLFTSFFVTALLIFVLYIKEKKNHLLYLATTLLALSALTRPVAFYLGIIIPGAIMLTRTAIKKAAMAGLLACSLYLAILSPWMIFITTKVHTLDFSSLSSFDLYAFHGKYFDEWRKRHNPALTDTLPLLDLSVINNTFDARSIYLLKSVGFNYLQTHFFEYTLYHFLRLPNLYTDSGYASILNGVPGAPAYFGWVEGGVLEELIANPRASINLFFHRPINLLPLIADLFFVLIATLALSSPFIHFLRHRAWPPAYLFLTFVLLIYTFLASPIGGPRLRIPINPILFFLGAIAALDWVYFIKTRLKIKPQ